MSKAASVETDAGVPRGGVWERQVIYGGARMREEFASHDPFILWELTHAGEVPVDEDGTKRMVDKTVLTVSRLTEPDAKLEVGTLSSAIAAMVAEVKSGDLPVECYWEEVETKRGLAPATVLTAVRRWQDPAND